MDETKLREILTSFAYGELGMTAAIEAIKALLPPKIPVYKLDELALPLDIVLKGGQ